MNNMSFAIEPAVLVDIHQESKKDFVQGVKKDEHSLSDNSHSLDVIQEEKCHVLKYKVHDPRQELFHYANVDKFIRDFYLPKNKEERMSAKLLEEINQRIANLKLDVITHDFDEYGAVSINATYVPIGFNSWEDYLRTII